MDPNRKGCLSGEKLARDNIRTALDVDLVLFATTFIDRVGKYSD